MRSAVGLGLALVVLLVASVVSLAASQTFINKTGKTVAGITITFFRNVTITRHDSAFPDQSPSGRSDEVTFSGGNLRNLGRFSITWMPSSAKVTNYEWIEKAQPSQESQATSAQQNNTEQDFTLPDPNTPPILYGNDYPGPDEPKYQPASDEQIWLTDMDGHEDIYDNDGIKINYVPGFDVSHITRIDVYRNAIKLRFVPEKFDVLTNAQMKTFDGNPTEHSPASAHTDHAIMGYEYRLDIHSADHVWMMTKTVKSGFRWRPKEVWAQMDNDWTNTFYRVSKKELTDFFKVLKRDHFTGISFSMVYYVNSPNGNNLIEVTNNDPSITNMNERTPTLSELGAMLKAISEAGLDARVMAMFYVRKSYIDAHKDRYIGKAMIDPSNPKLFFENYTRLLEKLIPLLNKYHVKSLVVLDETNTLDVKYPDLIDSMLWVLSKEFNGELGIDTTANHMLEGRFDEYGITSWQQAVSNMTFLGWTSPDGERLENLYSCWTPSLEIQKDQRASVMTKSFVKFWKPLFDYVAVKYSNPPQGFGEIGTYVADGVALGSESFWRDPNKKLDEQEFADVWYSYLRGAEELNSSTMNVWIFSIGDTFGNQFPEVGYLSTGFKRKETPAYRVVRAIVEN